MYKTLVRDRPVVPYACETWVLKENIKGIWEEGTKKNLWIH